MGVVQMIAIKDMEMPKNCIGCPMFHKLDGDNNYQCIIMRSFIDSPKSRADGCPLVEIVTCKDCKHWKDSDGVYRRGIGAESKCPINIKEVFDGNFYCADGERRVNYGFNR